MLQELKDRIERNRVIIAAVWLSLTFFFVNFLTMSWLSPDPPARKSVTEKPDPRTDALLSGLTRLIYAGSFLTDDGVTSHLAALEPYWPDERIRAAVMLNGWSQSNTIRTHAEQAPDAALRAAMEEYRASRYENAAAQFEALVATYPGDPDARNNYGLTLVMLGKMPEAQLHLETVRFASPDHAPGFLNLALVYLLADQRQAFYELWKTLGTLESPSSTNKSLVYGDRIQSFSEDFIKRAFLLKEAMTEYPENRKKTSTMSEPERFKMWHAYVQRYRDTGYRIAAVEKYYDLMEAAMARFRQHETEDSEPVNDIETARARALPWGEYVETYRVTGYKITEAEGYKKKWESWSPPPRTFDLGNGVSLEMVWIPGGTFQMGSPESESGRDSDEGPVHEVELDGFWMGKYEVTQEQYQAIMGSNPSNFKGAKSPVEMVSWDDAVVFCRKLAARTGQPFTLPTEAQWEYACRGGSQTRFHFGDSDSQLGDYAWYFSNSGPKMHPVGQKRPNPFGLYDMHGNVWEWCADWYGDYTSGRQKNPTGPDSGSRRVYRGGSWSSCPGFCRSAFRGWDSPGIRYYDLGFRPALSPVR